MKKLMLLALIASANLYAAEEVKLKESYIKSSKTYEGSVTQNESKNMVIITKKDIEKKQYPDLVTIFKDSPVTMVTYTPTGPLIALRGSGEKTVMRVKVLVDGKKISTMDDAMGVIPFNSIPVSTIEKIEIVPGGGITLYGSGSSSGVINIITKAGVTKPYGEISVGMSTFGKSSETSPLLASISSRDTYEVSVNKGIPLGEKVFLNLAVEGKKGKGYRDKEKTKKLNLIAGVNMELNNKNRLRLQATKYKEDADSTKEISLKQMKKNRREAGSDLTNTKSNRKNYSLDYEYRPTKNLTLNASASKSKFTRDINQKDKPYVTVLGGAPSFGIIGRKDLEAHLATFDTENKLVGKHEEKINTAKLSGNYKYQKGNLAFGFEKVDHSLVREMHSDTGKMDVFGKFGYLTRPKNSRAYTEEELYDKKDSEIIPLYSVAEDDILSQVAYLNDNKFEKRLGEIALKYAKEREKKILKKELDILDEIQKNPNTNIDKIQNMINMRDAIDRTRIHSGEKIREDLYATPMKDLFEYGDKDADGVEGILEKSNGEKKETAHFDKNKTFGEFFNQYGQEKGHYDPSLKMQSVMNAKVDAKKYTNSFYLYNDYNITNKLKMNTGLRYEKADYKGTRNSEVLLLINGDASKGVTSRMMTLSQKTTKDSKGQITSMGDLGNFGIDAITQKELQQRLLKTKNSVEFTQSSLKKDFKRKEENLGGELGFNYSINDTDNVYVKYERAFNTPLPTQLTNKTWDYLAKMRLYWDSNLKTEKIHNFEIGYRGMLADNVSFSIAGFMSQTKDEIVTAVKNGNSHMKREWRFLNIDKTRRLGVELQSEQAFDKLRLKESFTYVDPRIISNDFDSNTKRIVEDRIKDYKYNLLKDKVKRTIDIEKKIFSTSLADMGLPSQQELQAEMQQEMMKLHSKRPNPSAYPNQNEFYQAMMKWQQSMMEFQGKMQQKFQNVMQQREVLKEKGIGLFTKGNSIGKELETYYNEILKEIETIPEKIVNGDYNLRNYYDGEYNKTEEYAKLEKRKKDLLSKIDKLKKKFYNQEDIEMKEKNYKGELSDEAYEKWYRENEKSLFENSVFIEEKKVVAEMIKYEKDTINKENISTILKNIKSYEELSKLSDKYEKKYQENFNKEYELRERLTRKGEALSKGYITQDEYDKFEAKIQPEIDKYTQLENEAAEKKKDIQHVKMAVENIAIGAKIETDTYKDDVEEELKKVKSGVLKKNQRIPMVPKVKATFGADYEFTDKLKMGTTITYVGSYDTLEPVGKYNLKISKVPGHLLTDIYGTYDFNQDLSMRFGVNNLFNHEYNLRQDSVSGTPAPGRTYSAGFTYKF